MAEEEKKEEEEDKEQEEDKAEEKPKTMIEEAKVEADRIEAANKKTEELLQRQEVIEAKKMLGGQTDGGQQPIKAEPISDIDFSIKVEKGETNPIKKKITALTSIYLLLVFI